MNQNFLLYLKESIALNLPHDEKEKEPLLIKSDEKSIHDIPRMQKDYEEIKEINRANRRFKQERASILKKYNLKIENGEIKEKEPIIDNDQLGLFGKKEVSNKVNEFSDEVKSRLEELEEEIERTTPDYKKNLMITLKRFFMLGGKLPKRYVYLPVSNQINISEIEKINNNHHLDMLLKIKNGAYANLSNRDQELFNYLIDNGYNLTKEQYVKNICVNQNGKHVPIDKELININMIDIEKKKKAIEKQRDISVIEKINLDILRKERFKSSFLENIQEVKKNSNILNNSVIILTWVPRLVMAQSTNTIWRSCMTYSFSDNSHGVNIGYVPKGIQAGVFIAWLVNLKDRHIKKPMARTLLKPTGKGDKTFYWPSKIYTESGEKNLINLFDSAVKKYCFLKQKNILDKKDVIRISPKSGVYDDGDAGKNIINFGVVIDNLKTSDDRNFDPSEFIREYLRPRLTTFDFKESDFDFLFNYKPLVDYIDEKASEGEIHAYYHFLASKIIELEKYSYFSEFFKDKTKSFKKDFIFMQLFFENSLNTLFLENPKGFKYFLNICYEKDYLDKIDKKDLDIERKNFEEMHSKCSIYSHYGRFIKTVYDHFGKDIYLPKKIDDSLRQLFYSDLKVSEILPIYRDLGLQFERYGTLLTVLFKNNRDNFYDFYKIAKFENDSPLVASQLMEIISSALYAKNYKDFDEILAFIKKEKIFFNNETYRTIPSYSKANFVNSLYSLIYEKNLDMLIYYKKMLDVGFNFVQLLEQTTTNVLMKSPNDVNLTLIYDFFLRNQASKILEKEYRELTNYLLGNEQLGQIILIDVISGIVNSNQPYTYLVDFLKILPKYKENKGVALEKLADYIIDNKLNENEQKNLFELLNQKDLLINKSSSFKTIILSNNINYYSKYLDKDFSIFDLLECFINNIINKIDNIGKFRDKNFYIIRDTFIDFIKQNHKQFKKEKTNLRALLNICSQEVLYIIIPIIKKLNDVIEATNDDIKSEIEFIKKMMRPSGFLLYVFIMYENDSKKLEEDLKLIGQLSNTSLIKFINNGEFDFPEAGKMYFIRGSFELFMNISMIKEDKERFIKNKCVEFATNHRNQKEDFYNLDELKLFITFMKKHNMEKFFKDLINEYVLREESTEEMENEYQIYEKNDPESLYKNFIRYLKLQPNNNPLLSYIDKEVFLSSILLKDNIETATRVNFMDIVVNSEDIKNKKIEEIVKKSLLKNKYSDFQSIVIAKLTKLFGKTKIEELSKN